MHKPVTARFVQGILAVDWRSHASALHQASVDYSSVRTSIRTLTASWACRKTSDQMSPPV
jgi:hypothetical protein